MHQVHIQAALCGIASAMLLGLVSGYGLMGILVTFLPLLPLLWIGLTRGVLPLLLAAILAFVLSFLVLDPPNAVAYGLTQVLATVLFTREIMKLEVDTTNGDVRWAPVGHGIIAISLAAALGCTLISILLPDTLGELIQALREDLKRSMRQADPQVAQQVTSVVAAIPHLLLALVVWLWTMLLYGFAVLVNFAAVSYQRAIRPSLRLKPFFPPLFFLLGLLSLAVASLLLKGKALQLCHMLLILLLLPYFFCGLSHIHTKIGQWRQRQAAFVFFYSLLVFFQWPIFIITFYGVAEHLRHLLERRTPRDA